MRVMCLVKAKPGILSQDQATFVLSDLQSKAGIFHGAQPFLRTRPLSVLYVGDSQSFVHRWTDLKTLRTSDFLPIPAGPKCLPFSRHLQKFLLFLINYIVSLHHFFNVHTSGGWLFFFYAVSTEWTSKQNSRARRKSDELLTLVVAPKVLGLRPSDHTPRGRSPEASLSEAGSG